MRNFSIIALSILLTLISNYLGYTNPPFSIITTPVLIGLITGLILYLTDYRTSVKFTLIASLIITNDLLIKIFAGGTHDWEGVGWIFAFLLMGLIIALVLILFYSFTKHNSQKKKYFLYLFATSVILFSYIFYFNSYGLIWLSYPTENIEISKEKGLFKSDIELSDNSIIVENDTFLIIKGWTEQQIRYNHVGLIKSTEITDKIYCTLIIEGDFKNLNYNNPIYYKLKESESKGFSFLEGKITLTFDKMYNNYHLEFYKSDRIKIKEIEINIKNGL